MAVTIKSKHAVVSKAPSVLYMVFVDMRNFLQFLPEDKKQGVTADYDTLKATVQGFNVGVRIVERLPYSRIGFADDGAPFSFGIKMFFDSVADNPDRTDFHIEMDAELNFMMKMMLESKIREALDRIVDGLAAVSEGRIPDGVDPSAFNGFKS